MPVALRPYIVAVAAVCVLAACAGTPKPPLHLADNLRSTLGPVGVMTVGPSVGGSLDAPVGVGRQAAIGVIEGAAIGAPSGFVTGALLGLLCGPGVIICTPVGALAGGVIGLVGGGTYAGISKANHAVPQSTAAEIQTALIQAISDHDLQVDLRNRVLQYAGGAAMALDLGAGGTVPVASPDYKSLAAGGASAVLEISLTQLTFTGEGGENPTLSFLMSARARLIRAIDGRILWNAEQIEYQSAGAASSLWVARDSDLLKAEIARGLESLARQMDEALFLKPGGIVSSE